MSTDESKGEGWPEIEDEAGLPAETALSGRELSSDENKGGVSKGDCNGSLGSSELPSNSLNDNGRRDELVESRNVTSGMSGEKEEELFVDEPLKKCRGSGRCTSGADEVNGGPFWVWDISVWVISVWDISVSGSWKKFEPRGCLRAFRARLRK